MREKDDGNMYENVYDQRKTSCCGTCSSFLHQLSSAAAQESGAAAGSEFDMFLQHFTTLNR